MLEYDPYYFRGQELYSFKPHLIAIEKKIRRKLSIKNTRTSIRIFLYVPLHFRRSALNSDGSGDGYLHPLTCATAKAIAHFVLGSKTKFIYSKRCAA